MGLTPVYKKTKLPVGRKIKNDQNSQPVTAICTKCGVHFNGGVGVLVVFAAAAKKFRAHFVNRYFLEVQLDRSITGLTYVPEICTIMQISSLCAKSYRNLKMRKKSLDFRFLKKSAGRRTVLWPG